MVRAFAWIAAGCALAVGCESSSPDWCPDLPGIPTETVTTPTSWNSPPELTEAWAVGGLTEGQEFVMPNAVAIDPNTGHIAVADFRLGNVAVISREGDWLTRLSKPGKGPGEFSVPLALSWTPEGYLTILDGGNSKMLTLRIDGSLVEEGVVDPRFTGMLLGSGMMWAFLQNQDIVGQPGPKPVDGAKAADFVVLRAQHLGELVDTIAHAVVQTFQPGPLSPIPVPGHAIPIAASLGDGRIAVAGDVPEYRIRILDRTGKVVQQICRNADPIAFSARETSGMENANLPNLQEDLDRAQPAGNLARIGRLVPGADGEFWAQRDRPSPLSLYDRSLGPKGATFDVFDSDGVYRGIVKAPDDVRVVAVTSDLIVGLRSGELGDISVVAYRMTTRSRP